jgi:uncharacterized protein
LMATEINNTTSNNQQYSLQKIIFIWVLSAFPMGILAYVVAPKLEPLIDLPPLIIYWLAVIVGLIWQFVLSLIILRKEGYRFNWATIRDRAKYQTPRNPRTGKPSFRLFLWLIPFIILSAFISSGVGFPDIDCLVAPLFKNIPKQDMSALATADYKGAWWILGLYIVTFVFNYLLGEEFLYRGVLLPRMNGVFGKWDWFANGVLFGFYHLHKPHMILSTALVYGFVFSFPSKWLQSSWMGLIIHGLEGVLGLVIVLGVVLGLG